MQKDGRNFFTDPSRLKSYLIWVAGTSVGWALFQYAGLRLAIGAPSGEMRNWSDVFRLAGLLTLNGAVLGAISGILQAIVLHLWLGGPQRWWLATFVGYAAGLPLGLLLSVATIWLTTRSWSQGLLSQDSGFVLFFPTLICMLWTGGIIALFQLLLSLRQLPTIRVIEKLLWVLGNAVSWVIGFMAASAGWLPELPQFAKQAIAGGTIGLLTVSLFLLLLHPPSRRTIAASAVRT